MRDYVRQRRRLAGRRYFRRVVLEPLESRSLLAALVNVGTENDVVFELPAAASTVVLEDDGILGNGISWLRSLNGTFDTTPFANPGGSLTISRGNVADVLTVNGLPDFTAGLTIGSAAGPLSTVTFAGLVNLGADKSLTAYASGTIRPQWKLQTSGSGSIFLTTQRDIALSPSSSIVTVDGNLTLSANQQTVPTTGNFAGIDLNRATVQVTGSGNLAFFGRGGGALSTSNHGIQLRSGAVVSSTSAALGAGTITLQGTVGEGSQSSAGVAVFNDQTSISSVRGNISIIGLPANTAAATNWGILVGSEASISSTGPATISLNGTGGLGRFNNDGIVVAGDIRSAVGDISLIGQGGTAAGLGRDDNDGIEILGTIESTGTANITIVGQGGSGTFNNQGVQLEGVVKSASGKITVTGTGGQGDRLNNGFFTEGAIAKIQSIDGDISITGIAGTATSGPFSAVGIGGAGVEATGSGAISISGSGGLNSYAVSISGPIKSTSAVQITGNGGGVACGIAAQGSIDTSLTGAEVKLTADCMLIGTQPINAGNGTVTLKPLTTGTSINLGLATKAIGGPLALTDAELDAITAGTLQIGDANSGPITVSAEITPAAAMKISLTSGSSISFPNEASRLSASGSGAISLAAARNISLASGSSITSVDGAITLAGNQQATPTSGNFVGVDVDGATIRATGAGAVTVQGKGGDSSVSRQHGVEVQSGGLIEGGTGGLVVVGQGGLVTSGSSAQNFGVYVHSAGQLRAAGSGSVTVQGIGGFASQGGNDGVRVRDNSSAIASSDGDVRVTGQGGSSTAIGISYGVQVDGQAQVSAVGSGAVIVHGTGGTASPGGMNGGVRLWAFGVISSVAGDIEITGQGGGTGTSGMNYGVDLASGRVQAGSGDIKISGTGGATSGDGNHGVWVGSGAEVTNGGSIQITGQGGGSGSSGNNYGVLVQGHVVSEGTGSVVVQGTGGTGSGSGNSGVILGSFISSNGGGLQVTGIEGGGSSGIAIEVEQGTVSTAASGGPLTLIGNSIDIASAATITAGSSGVVTLRPYTAGVGIDLGRTTDSIGGPLALTNAELARITAGTLQIGDANSGPITVSEEITPAAVSHILLTSGSSISLPNATSRLAAIGNGSISLTAARNISLANGSSITSVDGAITLAANQQATPTSGSLIGVDVNGATIQATGAGSVAVQGKGGNSVGGQIGVRVRSSGLVKGGTGGVEVVGFGGMGPSGGNDGVRVSDGSAITSSGGTVQVTGQGGPGSLGANYGVEVYNASEVSAGGTGAVIVHGTGGAAGASYNTGVRVSSAWISSSAGDIEINGRGGGIETSHSNRGVELFLGDVRAGGSGKVTLHGTGGSFGDDNFGVWVIGSSEITSTDGDIQVWGQGGGSGASGGNYGLFVQGFIDAGGAGGVLLEGTGGDGAGPGNIGVYLNGRVTSSPSGGTVQVTGIEGTGASGIGIHWESGGITTAAGNGAYTLTGNSVEFDNGYVDPGAAGTVTIKPLTRGVGINLGLATDAIGGPLALTDAELARITAGTIQIGDPASGAITVSAPLTLAGRNFTLVTGAGVSGSQQIVNGSATQATLTFDQAGDSTYSGRLGGVPNATADQQNLSFTKSGAGKLTITGTNNYSGDTTISQGTLKPQGDGVIPRGVGKGNVVFNPSSGEAKLELEGGIIYINGLWSSGAGSSVIELGGTLWVGFNDQSATFGGTIQGTGSNSRLGKLGTGTLTLTGSSTTRFTDVPMGTLLVNGSVNGEVLVNGGTLGGSGTVGAVNVSRSFTEDGQLAPGSNGPGVLSTGKLLFSIFGTFEVELNGPAPGSQYDQINVTGTVALTVTPLHITLDYSPAAGEQFTIINNDSTDAVSGSFGYGEGYVFPVTTGPFRANFRITYQGGDGNDVVLTAVNQAPTLDVNLPPLTAEAVVPELVEDVNPGAGVSVVGPIEVVNGIAYFAAETPESGVELWRSDGTAAGTWMVKDIFPGSGSSRPADLTRVGNILYFRADDGARGVELWRSEGTDQSTVLVKDVLAGEGSSYPSNFVDVNGRLFFTAAEEASGPTTFFGPSPYLSAADSPFELSTLGTDFWLEDFEDGALNTPGVSASSGSVRGPGSNTDSVDADDGAINGDGHLGHSYVVSPGAAGLSFVFDAQALGGLPTYVGLVATGGGFSLPTRTFDFYDAGGNLIGSIDDNLPKLGSGDTSDDSFFGMFHAGGISMVRERSWGTGNTLLEIDHLQYGGVVAPDSSGFQLWSTTGFDAGTIPLARSLFVPQFGAVAMGDSLFFTGNDGTSGVELWKSDGTPEGTAMLRDIRPGSDGSGLHAMTAVDGRAFFAANDGVAGSELWSSDGTSEGTALVADIFPGTNGSNPSALVDFNGRLFFAARDGVNGSELWMSEGSADSTTLVKDMNPNGSSSPQSLTNVRGNLFLVANDGAAGFELWKSDGTPTGTTLVKDIHPGGSHSNPNSLANVNGLLFFSAAVGNGFFSNPTGQGYELWISDGSQAGTVQAPDIAAGGQSSSPTAIVSLGQRVLFTADDGVHGRELWAAPLDAMSVLEDADTQTINLSGISAGGDPLQGVTIRATSDNPGLIPDPTINYASPNAGGSLSFKPVADRSGTATITVTVQDDGGTAGGGVDTLVRTFTVVVVGVNDAPSFVSGGDLTVTDEDGAQSLEGWAAMVAAGPAEEAAQALTFVVSTDRPDLFLVAPAVDSSGTLSFTPAPNVEGTAQVTVRLQDDGGTDHGGTDSSAPQTFTIEVLKPHRWHNAIEGLDVTGDTFLAPDDALAVINYLNAFGAGEVPADAAIGTPFYDATGDDFVAPNDALAVINDLNAFGAREVGGAAAEGEMVFAGGQRAMSADYVEGDWLALLAADVARQGKKQ